MSANTPVGTWIPTNNTQQSGSAYLNNVDADVDVLSRLAALFLPQALPTPAMQAQVLQGHVLNQTVQSVAVTGSTTSGSATLGSLSTMAGLTVGMGVSGTGIQAGATVTALNANGSATMSATATSTNGSEALSFAQASALVEVGCYGTGSTTSGSASLGSMSSVSGVQAGMIATVFSYVGGVYTLAAPSGSIVTSVNQSTGTVVLNEAATATVSGAWCSFAQPIGSSVTGTVTSGANTLGSLTTTAGMFVGMGVAGAGIPSGATIASITGPNSATMSANATATHAGEAIAVTVPLPASNSRIDRVTVNQLTGLANWVAGTAAASPVPPAIPAGQSPIAQLLSTTSSTALTNTSSIWDERDLTGLGGGSGSGAQVSLASAATTDLGTAGTRNILVTGTSAITSLGSSASVAQPIYDVEFAASLTLTYNATSLILPGSASITTEAGDTMRALYLGAGNWKILSYSDADGSPISVTGPTESVASSATTSLGAAGSNLVAITGTSAITSFGSAAVTGNPLYWVRFTAALTLTYNATSMILPGAANITTAAGDAALFEYLGSGNWRCHYYAPATGKALSSPQLQHQVFTSSGTFTAPPSTGANTNYKITVIGGGGGGGGANATSQWFGGGGGGAGTAVYYGSGLTAGQTCGVTVGTGGSGAPSGGTTSSGSTGGTSSVVFNGTTISASGGVGGTSTSSSTPAANGGAGGTGTNGTINITGGPGGFPGVPTTGGACGGVGGASSMGGGAQAATSQSSGTSAAGSNGTAPGSGGGGGVNEGAAGNGANGVVIFEWAA